MNRTGLVLGFVAGILLIPRPSNAQYTSDFQTNIISGITSNWSGNYYVGNTNCADALLIQSNGVLTVTSVQAYLGYTVSSSNNSVVVTGTSSVWRSAVGVGPSGSGNSLVISNGGQVIGGGSVGYNYSDYSGGSSNSVIVTGSGSIWSNNLSGAPASIGSYIGGYYTTNNRLVISDGGKFVTSQIGIGSWFSGANFMIVSGGSVVCYPVFDHPGWISLLGSGSSIVITNGGRLSSAGCDVGGSNTSMLVTGSDSVWSNSFLDYGGLSIGVSGSFGAIGFRLVIDNDSQVFDTLALIGGDDSCRDNNVRVLNGAIWGNISLFVGSKGSSNSVIVAGGSVFSTDVIIGRSTTNCDNWMQLDSGSVTVSNATGDATLEISHGYFVQNGGMLQVDRFVMTNACAQFVRTGGTFIYGTALLDPSRDDDGDGIPNGWEQSHGRDPLNAADVNADTDGDGQSDLAEFQSGTDPTNSASAFRISEITPIDDDILLTWSTVGGKKYAVQSAAGGEYTNNFTEFQPAFIAPGTGESEMSVIHLGGATNLPGRFYRIRLVP